MRCNVSCCEVLWNGIAKHDSRTGYLFSCLTNKRRPVASVFITLSKEYNCDPLAPVVGCSTCRHAVHDAALIERRAGTYWSSIKKKRSVLGLFGFTNRLILVHWSTTVCKNCVYYFEDRTIYTLPFGSRWLGRCEIQIPTLYNSRTLGGGGGKKVVERCRSGPEGKIKIDCKK
jgi:hypothetical protein